MRQHLLEKTPKYLIHGQHERQLETGQILHENNLRKLSKEILTRQLHHRPLIFRFLSPSFVRGVGMVSCKRSMQGSHALGARVGGICKQFFRFEICEVFFGSGKGSI